MPSVGQKNLNSWMSMNVNGQHECPSFDQLWLSTCSCFSASLTENDESTRLCPRDLLSDSLKIFCYLLSCETCRFSFGVDFILYRVKPQKFYRLLPWIKNAIIDIFQRHNLSSNLVILTIICVASTSGSAWTRASETREICSDVTH